MVDHHANRGAGCILFLSLLIFNAHGQLNIELRDTLRHGLNIHTRAQDRLPLLKELAWTYLFSTEALPYLDEMDTLTATLLNDPDASTRSIALAYRSSMHDQRGYQHKFRRDMVAAQRDFQEAIRTARENHDTLNIANGLSAMGASYLALELPELALRSFNEEMDLIMSTAEKPAMYSGDIREHQAEALMRLGRVEEARNVLEYADTSPIDRRARILMAKGRISAHEGDTAQALLWMDQAQRVMRGTTQAWDLLSVLQPYGRALLEAGRTTQARSILEEAISVARRIGDRPALTGCLVLVGRSCMMMGDMRGAEQVYGEAMDIAVQHDLVGVARESGDEGGVLSAASALQDLFKAQGRLAEALLMAERSAIWKDTLHALEDRDAVLRFELQHAALSDSIADAIRLAEATEGLRTTLEQERSQRRSMITIGLATFCIVCFGLYLLWYRRKQERTMDLHTLERQEQERMIADLRMRELMSEDLHEELGAGLSALKLWSEMDLAEETDPRRRQLLTKRSAMADELMASLRQIIWALNSPSTTLKQLVDYLVDHAHLQCAQHGLRLVVTCAAEWPQIILRPEQRRSPFLALKEILNNTAQHSGADRVDLQLRWDNGLIMDLRDNGRGTRSSPESLPGNGLRQLKRRMASIGGTVHLDGSMGLHVQINIPLGVPVHNESSALRIGRS
jgi:two-component system, NarL family, sensor histidine kinase DesK